MLPRNGRPLIAFPFEKKASLNKIMFHAVRQAAAHPGRSCMSCLNFPKHSKHQLSRQPRGKWRKSSLFSRTIILIVPFDTRWSPEWLATALVPADTSPGILNTHRSDAQSDHITASLLCSSGRRGTRPAGKAAQLGGRGERQGHGLWLQCRVSVVSVIVVSGVI